MISEERIEIVRLRHEFMKWIMSITDTILKADEIDGDLVRYIQDKKRIWNELYGYNKTKIFMLNFLLRAVDHRVLFYFISDMPPVSALLFIRGDPVDRLVGKVHT